MHNQSTQQMKAYTPVSLFLIFIALFNVLSPVSSQGPGPQTCVNFQRNYTISSAVILNLATPDCAVTTVDLMKQNDNISAFDSYPFLIQFTVLTAALPVNQTNQIWLFSNLPGYDYGDCYELEILNTSNGVSTSRVFFAFSGFSLGNTANYYISNTSNFITNFTVNYIPNPSCNFTETAFVPSTGVPPLITSGQAGSNTNPIQINFNQQTSLFGQNRDSVYYTFNVDGNVGDLLLQFLSVSPLDPRFQYSVDWFLSKGTAPTNSSYQMTNKVYLSTTTPTYTISRTVSGSLSDGTWYLMMQPASHSESKFLRVTLNYLRASFSLKPIPNQDTVYPVPTGTPVTVTTYGSTWTYLSINITEADLINPRKLVSVVGYVIDANSISTFASFGKKPDWVESQFTTNIASLTVPAENITSAGTWYIGLWGKNSLPSTFNVTINKLFIAPEVKNGEIMRVPAGTRSPQLIKAIDLSQQTNNTNVTFILDVSSEAKLYLRANQPASTTSYTIISDCTKCNFTVSLAPGYWGLSVLWFTNYLTTNQSITVMYNASSTPSPTTSSPITNNPSTVPSQSAPTPSPSSASPTPASSTTAPSPAPSALPTPAPAPTPSPTPVDNTSSKIQASSAALLLLLISLTIFL